jgi:uncharacterized membrane protein
LISGLFFAFSVSVMKALGRLPAAGTAVGSALVIIASLLRWHYPGSVYLLVGSAFYLVGSFLVTVVFNVPKNEALAAVAPIDPNSASLWADSLLEWTAWNHVRTVGALMATACY